MAVLILATAPRPTGFQWPPASQVENISGPINPLNAAVVFWGPLASNCTTMLVDLDSTLPAVVWVTPHITDVLSNLTARGNGTYYWSGITPVSHLSTVVSITDPAGGLDLIVLNASENLTGDFSFGSVFSANGCPPSEVHSPF